MRKAQRFTFRNFFHRPSLTSSMKPRPVNVYSFVPFSPFAMLAPTILTIGGIVLAVVFIEWLLDRWSVMNLADQFEKVMRFILPVTFYGALFYFFATFMF
ncbi:hypothetical protein COK01_02090 [Priestia megaterium]|uniref:hypothetical protein n=1 Tax=Priestia megaterium TaxID=1404 RepID=UPI000BF33246|nr:hypothetical protein [Priestia megaterium]PFP52020.1 hypothetical protein COK01_02090 [Priestia megaterium]